jgi:hypothetical protein
VVYIFEPRVLSHLLGVDSLLFEAEDLCEEVFGLLGNVRPVVVLHAYRATFGEGFDLL